jgi:hypothetical protein
MQRKTVSYETTVPIHFDNPPMWHPHVHLRAPGQRHALAGSGIPHGCEWSATRSAGRRHQSHISNQDPIVINAAQMITDGRQIFRFDTYGDEAFWGDVLHLHQAIEGSQNGGVGPGLSPTAALQIRRSRTSSNI